MSVPGPGAPVPAVVTRLLGVPEPVWRNEAGGLTFRSGSRYVKWAPPGADLDLAGEAARLRWAGAFVTVPRVLSEGDGWLMTEAVPGRSAIHVDPAVSVPAIGHGLRVLHDTLPVDACPFDWSVASRGGHDAPPVDRLVVCHGDACAPNTLVDDGGFSAHVDLDRLGVADRWADLAVATMSLDWNFGPGWQDVLLAAYGVARDEERIAYYRDLWNASG